MRGIAKALEMWYVDNNEYPANLDTLTPNYISSLPSDPFDPAGGSYRYYVNNTKTLYLIVSDGPDGDNDVPGTAEGINFTLSAIAGELGGPNGITGDRYLAGNKWHNLANGAIGDGDLGRAGP